MTEKVKARNRGSAWARTKRYIYLRFIRIRASDSEVAFGMALGFFVGMTPTMGFQIIMVIPLALLLRVNKVSATIGVFISNPVTMIPLYAFNFQIGKWILGQPDLQLPQFSSMSDILALGYEIFVPLWVGSLVMGLISAIIAYAVTYRIYRIIRLTRKRKIEGESDSSSKDGLPTDL